MTTTPWLELLEPLRDNLKGRDHRGKKGSLRWLEAVMTEQGGRAGTVRNILYKDLGSTTEKQRMFEILKLLYTEAELAEPKRPEELRNADAKRLLGRDKRLIYARFSRDYQQGNRPQMVVVGQPSTGKGILLEQLCETHPEHLFINLANDIAPALHGLARRLGITEAFQQQLALMSPSHPFALQAQHQSDMLQLFLKPLNALELPLFIRAEEKALLAGMTLRNQQSQELGLSSWLEPLLRQLSISYLLACSSAPASLPYKMLRAPSRQEARNYLRQRLPDVQPETLETILNKAGRNYGELSRLALLELCRAGEEAESQLHTDSRLGPMLTILAVLSPDADPEIPLTLLEAVLGKRITQLSQAEQALIESVGEDKFRPASRSLLPKKVKALKLHEQALAYYRQQQHGLRILYHAQAAGDYALIIEELDKNPAQLGLLPGLWQSSKNWPSGYYEALALAVVKYRSVLGDYAHPECKEALEVLERSKNTLLSAWARVKIAEALIDKGQYQEAEKLARNLPSFTGDAEAEALLVAAAIARWQGDYDLAQGQVQKALELPIPPVLADRAKLWQGLVAKDAGNFEVALESLRAVGHLPLLMGRARYQEGDILLRSGYSAKGVSCIREALKQLREHASAEEKARVRARLGIGLKRIGDYDHAALHFKRSLHNAPDAFTRSRIASEASLFESSRGRPYEALRLAAEAETFFRKVSDRKVEAAYRHRRTLYRLAVAYWVLETGEAYRAPLVSSHLSYQAKTILDELIPEVKDLAYEADRYASLYLDCQVLLAFMQEAEFAWERLNGLSDLPHSYLQQQLGLTKVNVLLRLGEPKAAAAELMSLRKLPPDPGLSVSKAFVEAWMMLELNQESVAVDIINEALSLPVPFRHQLGRRWGQLISQKGRAELATIWLKEKTHFALPEALALQFEAYKDKDEDSFAS
ncbi:MAG: tetratricopeptide repeat protein [Trueperaceae bacterium]|nr:tetratricopeptide repeat protein [Trueperaceae bacterium]